MARHVSRATVMILLITGTVAACTPTSSGGNIDRDGVFSQNRNAERGEDGDPSQ